MRRWPPPQRSFSPLLIGGRARGHTAIVRVVETKLCFSPLLMGGRARGGTEARDVILLLYSFQSPSHRGPCARRGYRPCAPTITDRFQSPSHRGPRARRSPPSPSRTSSVGFSPLLIGGRARGGRTRRNTPHTHNRFSPLLIGGRARGTLHAALRAILMYQFQSPSHRGPRARRERRLPQYPAHNPFQSPSHRGPRARLLDRPPALLNFLNVSVPFS